MHRNKNRAHTGVFIVLTTLAACSHKETALTAKDAFRPTADFHAHAPEVARELRSRTQRDGTLRSFQPIISTGTAALLAPPPPLSFDADRAPWWWDVFFNEAQGLLLANENGWRSYAAGACFDAYRGALAQPWDAKLFATPEANTPRIPETLPMLEPEIDTLKSSFSKALNENESIDRLVKVSEGRYVIETNDDRVLEFRRIEVTTALSELGPQLQGTRENWSSPCTRYLETWKTLRLDGRGVCLTMRGEAYAVAPLRPEADEKIAAMPELTQRLEARCALYGAMHARQMDTPQRRTLEAALKGNPLLRERVLARAKEITEVWIEKYRLRLQSGGGSP